MITVVYSVACSVDGYIADSEGSVDWLSECHSEGEDYGHDSFIAGVDAMVMGSTTYEQILGLGDWPYGDTPCWVLSGRQLPPASPYVTITDADPNLVLTAIEDVGAERVWLVGGGTLAGSFRARNLIDECLFTVVPIALGGGVPLFADDGPSMRLDLVNVRTFRGGAVGLHYERAADS